MLHNQARGIMLNVIVMHYNALHVFKVMLVMCNGTNLALQIKQLKLITLIKNNTIILQIKIFYMYYQKL